MISVNPVEVVFWAVVALFVALTIYELLRSRRR